MADVQLRQQRFPAVLSRFCFQREQTSVAVIPLVDDRDEWAQFEQQSSQSS